MYHDQLATAIIQWMDSWERCGNTTFYRKGDDTNPLAWHFADPYNWAQIVSAPHTPGFEAEGSVAVLYRKAPRYDWEALRTGISEVEGSREALLRVLRHTHEWAADLIKAKQLGVSQRDLRNLFESSPPEAKHDVLEGVGVLLGGFLELSFARQEPSEVDSKTVLVIEEGTPAERNADKVEADHTDWVKTIVSSDPARGLDQALSYFGIHEC